MKSQLQETEKQLARLNQNEQTLKQECEQARSQLADIQRNETTIRTELANAQKKVKRDLFFIMIRRFTMFLFSTVNSVRRFGNVSLRMMMMNMMKINIISSNKSNNFDDSMNNLVVKWNVYVRVVPQPMNNREFLLAN